MPPSQQVSDSGTSPNPQNTSDLVEPGEKVLTVVRKHWAGIAGIYLGAIVALMALLVLGFTISPELSNNLSSSASNIVVMAGVVIIVVLALVVLMLVYIYRLSRLTITDQSLVQIVQKGLFSRQISRLSMSNVEDVKVEQNGVLPHIFNFGTLTVQTAGEEDNFIFGLCPKPDDCAEQILTARKQFVQKYHEQ